jgi:cAMP-specific phosphodiesterase 4
MEELFHACDIGNPCLDYDNYMGWAALLAFEFDAQTRTEEKLDLVVSRELVYRGMGSFYSGQEWFLGSIVQPLWKEIADLRPNLLPFCTNIERNLERIREETRTCC